MKNFWFEFAALTGLILIIYGILFRIRTPKFRSAFGFIQPFARRNEEVWRETHRYAALPMIVFGASLLFTSFIPLFFSGTINRIPVAAMIVVGSVIVLTLTRRHIEKTFDEDGKRRG